MARRKLYGAALNAWNKSRGRARRSSKRRAPAKVRTRTRTVTKFRTRRSGGGGVRGFAAWPFLTGLLVPAIGVAAAGLVVRMVPQADNAMKRGAVAIGGGLLAGYLGKKLRVPAGLTQGLALGMGIDGVWRLTQPIRAGIPALAGGGPTGGLLAGRLSSGASRDSQAAAARSQR